MDNLQDQIRYGALLQAGKRDILDGFDFDFEHEIEKNTAGMQGPRMQDRMTTILNKIHDFCTEQYLHAPNNASSHEQRIQKVIAAALIAIMHIRLLGDDAQNAKIDAAFMIAQGVLGGLENVSSKNTSPTEALHEYVQKELFFAIKDAVENKQRPVTYETITNGMNDLINERSTAVLDVVREVISEQQKNIHEESEALDEKYVTKLAETLLGPNAGPTGEPAQKKQRRY